jgi:two-component system, NtrC family, sensor kinase
MLVFTRLTTSLVLLICSLVELGWLTHFYQTESGQTLVFPTMHPVVALCLGLVAFSLLSIIGLNVVSGWRLWLARVCAFPALSVGFARVFSYLQSSPSIFDKILFTDQLLAQKINSPVQIAPNTAISLLALGLGVLLWTFSWGRFFTQICGWVLIAFSSVAVVFFAAYLTQSDPIYQQVYNNSMTLATVLVVALLGFVLWVLKNLAEKDEIMAMKLPKIPFPFIVKFSIGAVLVAVVLSVQNLQVFTRLNQVDLVYQDTDKTSGGLVMIQKISDISSEMNLLINNFFLSRAKYDLGTYLAALPDYKTILAKLKMVKTLNQEQKQAIDEIELRLNIQVRIIKKILLIDEKSMNDLEVSRLKLMQGGSDIKKIIGTIQEKEGQDLQIVIHSSQDDLKNFRQFILLSSSVVLLIVILVGGITNIGISESIRRFIVSARAIATGDLSSQVVANSRDETGVLAETFNQMTYQLHLASQTLQSRLEFEQEQAERIQKKNLELDAALTEIKEVQSRLIESERMSMAGQLTAGIMHEINNPNAAIDAALSMVIKESQELERFFLSLVPPEDQQGAEAQYFSQHALKLRETAGVAQSSSRRIDAIVKNLRTFSKHQQKNHVYGDIIPEINTTLQIFSYQFVEVRVRNLLPKLLKIQADFGKINQVVLNLMINAAQSGASEIILSCKIFPDAAVVGTGSEPRFVDISFADNGKGISPELQRRIFEPFFSTKGAGNSGLGLSISRTILEDHGGELWIDSSALQGSIFVVRLPLFLVAYNTKSQDLAPNPEHSSESLALEPLSSETPFSETSSSETSSQNPKI